MAGEATGAQPAPQKRRRSPSVPADGATRSTSVRPALPRTTHRLLMMRGLDPNEAANLTAFINGIPVGDHTWSVRELNRLLFLRDVAHRDGWEH